jgi:NACHT domain
VGGTIKCLAISEIVALARGSASPMKPAARAADTAVRVSHGIDWNALLTQVGVPLGLAASVATIIAIIPMTRNGVLRAWRALLMRIGLPYHRYARKFIDKYGTYDNPYLRVKEKRDLRTTYVPLSFQSDDLQSVSVATEVLTSLPADHLVIVGDPGSGKSTLLRAYGVGMLRSRGIPSRRPRVVPYLIPMRELSAYLGENKGIADFITQKILNEYGVFKRDRAEEFFVRTLQHRQAIVMLDGLDEVPDSRQQAVLSAVIEFISDTKPERPTGQAKILLTCRTQNFEMLRENWISALGAQETLYALAPLRDSEITSYLLKFRNLFKSIDGPTRFMRSVRESKTLDLLRAPLILTIAVGLYADRPTMIPSTVSELYHRMIEELLDRHAFLHERRPDQSLLEHLRGDKYRFLREFSFNAALESGNFADFTRGDLDRFGVYLAPSLDAVVDGKKLITEIINHSGLLNETVHSRLLHFAHRSVQEFLAAEELRLRGDGDSILLSHADDLEWRQVVQFYTAGQEARQVDGFLRRLAKSNSELAAHCLQAARPSDEAARAVLDALEPITDVRITALAAATRSPRVPVRIMAVRRLAIAVRRVDSAISTINADVDGLLPLLETAAQANAEEIAALVPHIIWNVPDDPRLVRPLWQCLSVDGIEQHHVCVEIVERLLILVMEPNAFVELERQEPHERDFLNSLRWQAYPFKNALAPDHNIVTLLMWADYLHVAPSTGNRFTQAKAAGRLARVESDRRRTISFSLFQTGRIITGIELIGGLIITAFVFTIEPGLLLRPLGWWTLPLIAGAGELPCILVMGVSVTAVEYFGNSRIGRYLNTPHQQARGNAISYIYLRRNPENWFDVALFLGLIPLVFSIASLSLSGNSLSTFILLLLVTEGFFWIATTNIFRDSTRYYLHRPNEFSDMYEDPWSRHWLVPGRGPNLKLGHERGRVGGPGQVS